MNVRGGMHGVEPLHARLAGGGRATSGCVQAELLLRCEELRDALWELCDQRAEEAEAERARLCGALAATEHAALAGTHLRALCQLELDWLGARGGGWRDDGRWAQAGSACEWVG